MDIDISTQSLCEQVAAKVKSAKIGTVLQTWTGICLIVREQMLSGKGTKLDSFGTFSFTRTGEPVFNLSPEYCTKYRLRQSGSTPGQDSIPTPRLNLTLLCRNTGVERALADKIYTTFISVLGDNVQIGRNALIMFNKVAELNISKNEAKVSFLADFLTAIGRGPDPRMAPKAAPPVKVRNPMTGEGISECSVATPRPRERNPILQYEDSGSRPGSAPLRGAAKAQQAQLPRARNPMTGDGFSDISVVNVRPKERNPLFGNESDAGDTKAKTSTARRPSSAQTVSSYNSNPPKLSKENLTRVQGRFVSSGPVGERQAAMPDARAIAAKALGPQDIIARVRNKIVQRGGSTGIKGIGNLLRIMDDNGDRRLDKEELKYGLRNYGVDLNPTELEQLFSAIDTDRTGVIDFDHFLIALKGEMNERRKRMVRMAFECLDTDKSGVVTIDEMMQAYDFTHNPDVVSGKKTMREAAKEFMKGWERDGDDEISYKEFEDYYKGVSASIDDDDYFELMIRNAWRIAGGEGAAANTANKRVLVTNKDGSQQVVTVHNELGMKTGKDKAAMEDIQRRLAQQGINADKIELFGGADNTEKAHRSRPQQASKEAWAPSHDDRAGGAVSSRAAVASAPVRSSAPAVFDPSATLRRLLYNPPVSIEGLAKTLQLSVAAFSQQLAKAAFSQRIASLDKNISRPQVESMWSILDPGGKNIVPLDTVYEIISSKFGKDKGSTKTGSVMDKVIAKIMERCGGSGGIKGLQRIFAIMDDNGDKKISKEELKDGLQNYGISLNLREVDDVFTAFDRKRLGYIDVDEFFTAVRGDLNARRQKLVQMAFDCLDKDKSGVITMSEMIDAYDFSINPDVVSGKKTMREAAKEFMKQWERDGDDEISYSEFEDYYKEVSASIDGDDYFELMIRNAWRIAGGEGAAANTANKRVLVTNNDGSQQVVTVHNELGMKTGKDKAAIEDIQRRLAQQGINADKIELFGGADNTTKAKSKKPAAVPSIPQASKSSLGPQPKSKSAVAAHNPVERHMAALKVAAVFRGRLVRKKMDFEKRKQSAVDRDRLDEENHQNVPRPPKLVRPKGKSYIGF